MRTSIIVTFICLLVSACSSRQPQGNNSAIPLTEWEGAILVDSIGVFQYKDTLYYVNEPSDFVFKIPEGFTAHRGSAWDVDGVHLVNQDSTMVIELTAIDRGLAKNEYDARWEDLLSQIGCDNGDNRLYYKQDENGYLKVGMTEDCTPLVEKAHAIFDEDENMFNYHVHLVRFTFADSLAKQAARLNFDYIEPWPNNIYK